MLGFFANTPWMLRLIAGSILAGAAVAHAFPAKQNLPSSETEVTQPDGTLPFSKGKTFSDLDTYLAHRKELGTIDIPYYERLADGRYELITPFVRNYEGQRIFTRQELLAKYGFDH